MKRIYESFALKKKDKTPLGQFWLSEVTKKFLEVMDTFITLIVMMVSGCIHMSKFIKLYILKCAVFCTQILPHCAKK